MSKHRLSQDSTVYHYTLLYRFTRKHPFYWIYGICLLSWLFIDLVFWQLEGLIMFAGSFIIVLVLHSWISLLVRRMSPGTVPREWAWQLTFPFIGYLPVGYVPASSWNRANRHRLLVGFSIVALLYVWMPGYWLANAAAAHYFLLLPQLLYVRHCLRKHSSCLIKVNAKDISCYRN